MLTGQYWYYTAYFGLYLLMPVLNYLLENMSRYELKKALLIGFALFSFLPMLINGDIFNTANGYSMLWLCYLFVVGAYIRKYKVFDKISSRKLIVGFLGCIFIPLGIKFLIEYISWNYLEILTQSTFLTKYTSPNVVIEAVIMLVAFSRMKVSETVKRIIAVIAPTSFGIYLIHTNKLILEQFLFGKLEIFSQFSVWGMVCSIVVAALGIFSICILIECIRRKIFEICRVKNLALAIEQKFRRREENCGRMT